ncbi:MAG: hypothetical protein GY873_36705 [Bosea sp.]|jgi:hypothetical protein|nr:hypothetical protein [Bosea sp. (in: a-proteobacteria)]
MSKDRFQRLLSIAWGRVGPKMGLAKMAGAMELSDSKTISRALSCSNLPEAHTVFNSLAADPSALDEILHEYGFRLSLLAPQAANDMATAAGLSHLAGSFMDALADGHRDHSETLSLAEQCRPLLGQLAALVDEADAIKTGRAA